MITDGLMGSGCGFAAKLASNGEYAPQQALYSLRTIRIKSRYDPKLTGAGHKKLHVY